MVGPPYNELNVTSVEIVANGNWTLGVGRWTFYPDISFSQPNTNAFGNLLELAVCLF